MAPLRSHCKRGHPMEGDHVGVRPNGTRYCRTCKAIRQQQRRDVNRVPSHQPPGRHPRDRMTCPKGHPYDKVREKDGARICSICERARIANRPKDTVEQQRRKQLRRYGMTLEQYDEMLREQGGACLGCARQPEGNLYVDHDHATGLVRGLLCRDCNSALGLVRDDPTVLVALAAYLVTKEMEPSRH